MREVHPGVGAILWPCGAALGLWVLFRPDGTFDWFGLFFVGWMALMAVDSWRRWVSGPRA